VRVTVIHPGAIATNITENSGLGKPKVDTDSVKQSKMALPTPPSSRNHRSGNGKQ